MTHDTFRDIAEILDPEPDNVSAAAAQPSQEAIADVEALAACAGLDHSDTDNGVRLRKHFGVDLAVLEAEGARNLDYVVWVGDHWDAASGNDAAFRLAQRVGDLIILEAEHIAATEWERVVIDRARAFSNKPDEDLSEVEKTVRREAMEALDGIKKRKVARRKFGVTSKNRARLDAMLACAAPHLTRRPDTFNRDPYLLATKSETIRFVTEPKREGDIKRYARVEATPGHFREHFITKVVPVAYDAGAGAPRWNAFLEEFLPHERVRNFVKVFSGLGLLGVPIQRILFHYGLGANGKSIFMETLMRVVGPIGVGLPAESLVGDSQRSGSGAAPDLARLYGARIVRVLELPADKPLQEDLVKKLTGGEKIPVRNLFKGFFDFQLVFKAHMSGNGYPRVDGTDEGIWRRLAVVEWPKQIPVEKRREFEDVLADFVPEYSGILNWLIEGALEFLEVGLIVPEEVQKATDEYRGEMDPIGQFVVDCVNRVEGSSVAARELFRAYEAWSEANAKMPWKEARFGRVMKTKFKRDNGRIRHYLDCELHDVPARPRNPDDDYEPPGDPR